MQLEYTNVANTPQITQFSTLFITERTYYIDERGLYSEK